MTIEECEKALLIMKKNKSPSLDGLPLEYYVTFGDAIKDILVKSYNMKVSRQSNKDKLSLHYFTRKETKNILKIIDLSV